MDSSTVLNCKRGNGLFPGSERRGGKMFKFEGTGIETTKCETCQGNEIKASVVGGCEEISLFSQNKSFAVTFLTSN